jgi:radical SAM protein with 4Fe4S-binding SPASM domain
MLASNQLCFGPKKITLLILELTNACNLSCDYCYASSGGNKVIDIDTIAHAANAFLGNPHFADQLYFHFSGGEPLSKFNHLLSSIHQIRKIADKKKFTALFRLQTNGTLLSEDKSKILLNEGVKLGVTLETLDPNALMRRNFRGGKSSARQAYDGLRNAYHSGILARINITIADTNVNSFPEMFQMLLEEGINPNIVQLLPMFIGKGGISKFEEIRPDIRMLVESTKVLLEQFIKFNEKNPANHIYELSTVAMLRKMLYERYIPEMCDQSPCGSGRQVLSMDMNGNLFPCDGFNRHKLFQCGNIMNNSIEEMMSADPIQYLQQRNILAIQECSGCIWRPYCNAGCPHDISLNETYKNYGQLFQKSYLCEYYSAMIGYLFDRIANGLDPSLLLPSDSELVVIK